ncbi:MAG TPA: hypothetical protein VGW31_00375, partial [Hanamia sp.]|nr:hypothetical protein [Hanamia sp.]
MEGNTRRVILFFKEKLTTMKIIKVWFDEENIYEQSNTGHIIGNPLNWFARLQKATPRLNNTTTFSNAHQNLTPIEIPLLAPPHNPSNFKDA